MTDLASLVVKLEAQTAQYQEKLERATSQLKKFEKESTISAKSIGKGLLGAAIGAAAGFTAMAYSAINTADDMGALAEKTGVTVESLSQLEHAAKLSDTSFDQLAGGMGKLAKAAVGAAQGSDGAKKAFAAIGVSVKDSNGQLKTTEELLLEVADQFSQYEDGAGKAALAMELFGKSGAELIPFLNKGREGIEALKDEADRLGLTISGPAAEAAGDFNDNLERLKGSAKGLANQAAEQLLPMLSTLAENFAKSATSGGAMEAALKALSVTLKALVTAGIIVVSVFQQLGLAIYGNARAVWAFVNKDFKGAIQAYKDTYTDMKENVKKDMETISKIWADHVAGVEAEATKLGTFMDEMDKKLRKSMGGEDKPKKTLQFSDDKADDEKKKKAEAALEQIQQMELSLRQQADTYHMSEEAAMAYSIAQGELAVKFKEAGDAAEPYKDKLIDLAVRMADLKRDTEEFNDMMANIDDQIKDEVERKQAEIEVKLEGMAEVEEQVTDFEKKLRENMHDVLAVGIEGMLEGGVKNGAKGALEAFDDMLKKMAIQALAAKLTEKLFGGMGGAKGFDFSSLVGESDKTGGLRGGGGGGWMGAAIDWFGGMFRDTGGRGVKGRPYMIGTGAQPEMFIPDADGEFIPATAWGMMGKQSLTQNIYVQGRVDQRSSRQLALESARRQRIASMRLG